MRRKLLSWICRKVLKIKNGEICPKWFKFLFFPIISYYEYIYPNKNLVIDYLSCSYIICGQRYPFMMFEDLSAPPKNKDYFEYLLGYDENNNFRIKRILKEKL